VNDKDRRILNFYRVLQDPEQFAALQHRLEYTLYSREEHALSAEILRAGTGTAIEQAWAWYVNIQQGFSNKLLTGWV